MSDYEQHNKEIVRLRAQIESARKALEEIVHIGGTITDPRNVLGVQMCNTARAALKDLP